MAALTEREQKVKRILLQELERMNKKSTFGSSFTYAERQHLVKCIDFAFIDTELDKMREQYRKRQRTYKFGVPLVIIALVVFPVVFWLESTNGAVQLTWDSLGHVFRAVFIPVITIFGAKRDMQAIQRKMFIYEALRELSDVDEADLLLDESVQQADRLIDRLVERQLELERLYPVSLLRENTLPVRERVHH